MLKKIVISLTLSLSQFAMAAPPNSILITKSTGNGYYLYEDGYIKKKDIARAWILFNMDDDDVISEEIRSGINKAYGDGSPAMRSSLSLNEADCTEGKIRTLQTTYYLQKDGVAPMRPSATTESPDWHYPAPQTIGDAIFKAICKGPSKKRQK